MATITGGCLCGQVKYSVTGDAIFSGVCNCRNCQRYTGSAFEPVMAFPSASISISGTLKTFNDKGDSGKSVFRRFCPECSSGIAADAEVMPGVTMILAGSLDDAAVFSPGMEIYCDSAQPWTTMENTRKRFPKMPG